MEVPFYIFTGKNILTASMNIPHYLILSKVKLKNYSFFDIYRTEFLLYDGGWVDQNHQGQKCNTCSGSTSFQAYNSCYNGYWCNSCGVFQYDNKGDIILRAQHIGSPLNAFQREGDSDSHGATCSVCGDKGSYEHTWSGKVCSVCGYIYTPSTPTPIVTITWNASSNGGKIGSSNYTTTTVENGSTATPPSTTPTKDGYVFKGWYTSPECIDGTEVDWENDVMPAGDLMIYAKWEPVKHTVSSLRNSSSASRVV